MLRTCHHSYNLSREKRKHRSAQVVLHVLVLCLGKVVLIPPSFSKLWVHPTTCGLQSQGGEAGEMSGREACKSEKRLLDGDRAANGTLGDVLCTCDSQGKIRVSVLLPAGSLPWHTEPGDGSFGLQQEGASKQSSFLQPRGAGRFSLHRVWGSATRQCTKSKWVQKPDSSAQWRARSFPGLRAVVDDREGGESLDSRPSPTNRPGGLPGLDVTWNVALSKPSDS